MSIYAQDREVFKYFETTEPERFVHAFNNPVVPSDYYRAVTTIQDSSRRDMVCALLASPTRQVEYDGTAVDWFTNGYKSVWHPTIDTFLLCKALNAVPLSGVKRAIELGCGSGFVSKYLLNLCPTLAHLDVVDVDPNAVACAKIEISDHRAHFSVQEGTRFLSDQKYDLIFTNPPYIPRPTSGERNPYEGTELIEGLREAGNNLTEGGYMLLNTSQLCEHVMKRCFEQAPFRRRIVASLTVPFRVRAVLRNPQWLEYLQAECGLEKKRREGYDYWHTLYVSRIERQG